MGIAGFTLLLFSLLAAWIVVWLVKFNLKEKESAEFWLLLKADRDTALASIDHIVVEYRPPRPAAESTMFFNPEPESFRMDDPEDIARIFPVGKSPGNHFEQFGSIHLNIRTKSGTSPSICLFNDTDMYESPWISPAFNPMAGSFLRADTATAILDWIAIRRQSGMP